MLKSLLPCYASQLTSLLQALDAESKAKQCRHAVLQALDDGNIQLAREISYQASVHATEAIELNRRAACVIYAGVSRSAGPHLKSFAEGF